MNKQAEIQLPSSSDHHDPIRKYQKLKIKSKLFSSTPNSSKENGLPYPNQTTSPTIHHKNFLKQHSISHKNGKRFENDISVQVKKTNDKGIEVDRNAVLRRQKSFNESISRSKENRTPMNTNFGSTSRRYTDKFEIFRNKNSSSSSMNLPDECSTTVPGHRKSFSSDELPWILPPSSSVLKVASRFRNTITDCHDFDQSDVSSIAESVCSTTSLDTNSTLSSSSKKISRKSGKQVSSRYLLDVLTKSPSRDPDTNSNNNLSVLSLNSSQKLDKLQTNTLLKRVNSAGNNGTSSNKRWTLDTKGNHIGSSNLKPPSSPRAKGVGSLINMGLGFFRSKKSNLGRSHAITGAATPGESVHQLKLLHNTLVQWQYVNAKSQVVNNTVKNKAQSNLLAVSDSLAKLRTSVMQKKIQHQKAKLEMKLNCLVQSQIELLEVWEGIKNRHLSAVSLIGDYLYSVACRVPLAECANPDLQLVSTTLHQASYLSDYMESMLVTFTPLATEIRVMLSELADVVMMENTLLEECLSLINMVSTLEIEERSLRCSVLQLRAWRQQL